MSEPWTLSCHSSSPSLTPTPTHLSSLGSYGPVCCPLYSRCQRPDEGLTCCLCVCFLLICSPYMRQNKKEKWKTEVWNVDVHTYACCLAGNKTLASMVATHAGSLPCLLISQLCFNILQCNRWRAISEPCEQIFLYILIFPRGLLPKRSIVCIQPSLLLPTQFWGWWERKLCGF